MYADNETIMSITSNSAICKTMYCNSSYLLFFRRTLGQSFEILYK